MNAEEKYVSMVLCEEEIDYVFGVRLEMKNVSVLEGFWDVMINIESYEEEEEEEEVAVVVVVEEEILFFSLSFLYFQFP